MKKPLIIFAVLLFAGYYAIEASIIHGYRYNTRGLDQAYKVLDMKRDEKPKIIEDGKFQIGELAFEIPPHLLYGGGGTVIREDDPRDFVRISPLLLPPDADLPTTLSPDKLAEYGALVLKTPRATVPSIRLDAALAEGRAEKISEGLRFDRYTFDGAKELSLGYRSIAGGPKVLGTSATIICDVPTIHPVTQISSRFCKVGVDTRGAAITYTFYDKVWPEDSWSTLLSVIDFTVREVLPASSEQPE